MNVGTSAGNYVIELDPLTQGVCQQINQGLFGDPGIPTISSPWNQWSNDNSTVDASADTAVDGKTEGCFSGNAGRYFYYKVVLVQ